MRCDTARALMTRSLREPLETVQSRPLGKHLERCAGCRREREELEQFESLLAHSLSTGGLEAPVIRPVGRQIALLAERRPGSLLRRGLGLGGAAVLTTVTALQLAAPHPRVSIRLTASTPRRKQNAAAPPLTRETTPDQRRVAKAPAPQPGSRTPRLMPEARSFPRPAVPPQVIAARVPDSAYLDGTDARLTSRWMTGAANDVNVRDWLLRRLPPIKDDFVHVPLPRLASVDPKQGGAGEAIRQYEKEAAAVDTRLFRKVTIRLKACPLAEVCEALSRETGVRIAASRGVADENATVLVQERPAREIMREVARLFGYRWARAGDEGHYTYELLQDLRSQLAEEEMRNRDRNAALIALDDEMRKLQPLLQLSREELHARAEKAKGPDARTFEALEHQGWGAAQMYFHLSPQQLSALASGQPLTFSTHPHGDQLPLPDDMKRRVLQSRDVTLGSFEGEEALVEHGFGQPGAPLADLPDAAASVTLSLSRSELGQVSLHGFAHLSLANKPNLKNMFWGGGADLAVAASPSVLNPDNARVNAALKKLPEFAQPVSVKPEPSCPWYRKGRKPADTGGFELGLGNDVVIGPDGQMAKGDKPHVQIADIWEAVHEATGRPIIADAYSHAYEQAAVTVNKATLFDALCRVGDATHARWQRDGDYLLARSTSYFWDKIKEVPVRLLRRWKEDRDLKGVLPLEDVVQMSTLPDAQLDSATVGYVIGHCWNLEEWGISGTGGAFRIGLPGGSYMRRYIRFLGQLSPAQLSHAAETGLSWMDLQPAQRDALARLVLDTGNEPGKLEGLRFRVDYAPVGSFIWHPVVDSQKQTEQIGGRWPVVVGKTREAALASARKTQPDAAPDSIKKSRGALVLSFSNSRGDIWSVGGPGVAWRTSQ